MAHGKSAGESRAARATTWPPGSAAAEDRPPAAGGLRRPRHCLEVDTAADARLGQRRRHPASTRSSTEPAGQRRPVLRRGGRVSVGCGRRRTGTRPGGADRAATTGVGIDAGVLPACSGPFEQAEQGLDRRRRRPRPGPGGARGLADLHGGTAEARSEGRGKGASSPSGCPSRPGAGRPAEPAASAAEPAARRPPGPDRRGQPRRGGQPATAAGPARARGQARADGPEAVQAGSEFLPDVVLCDIGLPGDRRLRGGRRCGRSRRPTAACSWRSAATASERTSGWAREAGFDRYLVKPVQPDALLELLATYAPREPGEPTSPG